jgi:vacuolar-type H+-ATPase subunit F/Vma7
MSKKIKILLIVKDSTIGNSLQSNIGIFCRKKHNLYAKAYVKNKTNDARNVYKRKSSRPDIVLIEKAISEKPGKLVEEILQKAKNPTILYTLINKKGSIKVDETLKEIYKAIEDVQRQRTPSG